MGRFSIGEIRFLKSRNAEFIRISFQTKLACMHPGYTLEIYNAHAQRSSMYVLLEQKHLKY